MTRFFQRKWKLIGSLSVAILILSLVSAWIFGGLYSAPCNHAVALPENLPVEPVTFPSQSGAMIHGWLVVPQTNRAVVILQHGVHADKSTLVERARFLSQNGYAVLLFDFQAHGESIGKKVTLGHLESRDSRAAVEFAKARFPGKPVAVIGLSMGAAAAVLAEPPLDVQALVLEMMYPTVVDATKDRIEMRLGRLGRCLSPLLTAQLEWRIGCSPDDLRPLVCVEKIGTPKLFLAGTADQETPFHESEEMFARAASPKILVPFEGAHHQDLLTFAPGQYQKTVLDFLNENLK